LTIRHGFFNRAQIMPKIVTISTRVTVEFLMPIFQLVLLLITKLLSNECFFICILSLQRRRKEFEKIKTKLIFALYANSFPQVLQLQLCYSSINITHD